MANFVEYNATTPEEMSPGSPSVKVHLLGKYTPGGAAEKQDTLILSSKESSMHNFSISKKQV